MDFESDQVLEVIDCPHCGKKTKLIVDTFIPPKIEPEAIPVAQHRTIYKANGTKFMAWCLIILGVLVGGSGCLSDSVSKTAFQETTASVQWCSGAIIFASGFILYALGDIIESIRNK